MSEQLFDQFVVGSLLGDGYISKLNIFGFNHSEKQQAYFEHKVKFVEDAGYKVRTSIEDPRLCVYKGREIKGANKLNARTTKAHKWVELRAKWYPQGKKIVPADTVLTPITLAYWYMDDGSANIRYKHSSTIKNVKYAYTCAPYLNHIRLYTDGFDRDSQDLLEARFRELGIVAKHYTRPTGHRFLVIGTRESKERFKELVFPIIQQVPTMLYKIDHPLQSQFERLSEGASLNLEDAIVRTYGNIEP